MRKLDNKFHIEGEQIIKTSNGQPIPEDEPLFLIRGRDYLALPLLEHYRRLSEQDDCTEYHLEGLSKRIEEFRRFATANPQVMKQPGITRGL